MTTHPVVAFLSKVTLAHVVTYLLVGILAAAVFDYAALFDMPVIEDFMKPYGSVAIFVGPLVQVVRGAIVAAVLLPFRSILANRRGWLWLWLLLVGVGILSTSGASPGSIEGAVYSQLPLWYHLIGLPEMLIQTLLFSMCVGLIVRHPSGVFVSMPPLMKRVTRAATAACLAFVGYAVVSVIFALAADAEVTASANMSLAVQGVFVIPLLANGLIAFPPEPGCRSDVDWRPRQLRTSPERWPSSCTRPSCSDPATSSTG